MHRIPTRVKLPTSNLSLSTMEILLDKLFDFLGIVGDFSAQGAVVVGTEVSDNAVNHGGTEDAPLLIDGTLAL